MPVLAYGTGTAIYQKDAKDSVVLAVSKGNMRHIDCAEMYRNEESVGSALKVLEFKRKELFLTSKCKIIHGVPPLCWRSLNIRKQFRWFGERLEY